MESINVFQYSGGKDSTALLIYGHSIGLKFLTVFCDTGNESPETYQYIDYIEKTLNIQILRLYPKLDFWQLAAKKLRFPSPKARFCTTELKVIPFIDWLLNQQGTFKIYQGIRSQESAQRAQMNVFDDYFDLNRKNHYAKRKIQKWLKNGNQSFVYRPLFDLSAQQVFDMHKAYNIEPNPLYKMGFSRVGCFPCIMCRHSEIKLIAQKFPEIIEKIQLNEKIVGRTFFPPNYISSKKIPSIIDVINHIVKPDQIQIFPLKSKNQCESVYHLCE